MKCQICGTEDGVRGYETHEDHGMGPPPIQLCDPCKLVWEARKTVEYALKGVGDAPPIFQTMRRMGNVWVTLYYRMEIHGYMRIWYWCDAEGRRC